MPTSAAVRLKKRFANTFAEPARYLPSSKSRIVSTLNVEKVVKAPRNPVPISSRRFSPDVLRKKSEPITQPRRNEPETFTKKVPRG